MADISKFERSQKPASRKDAGDIQDHRSDLGKHNFKGPKSSKSGAGVSPHASGSPWKYGREDQSEGHSYAADYSRKGSSAGAGVRGPSKPADKSIPDAIYGGKSSDRGKQTKDHV